MYISHMTQISIVANKITQYEVKSDQEHINVSSCMDAGCLFTYLLVKVHLYVSAFVFVSSLNFWILYASMIWSHPCRPLSSNSTFLICSAFCSPTLHIGCDVVVLQAYDKV